MDLPFTASRRLTGANLFFSQSGAQLETAGLAVDAALIALWRQRAQRACEHLGWLPVRLAARMHRTGTSLALAAPCDQLFVATEVNEWALCAALHAADPRRWAGLEQALCEAAVESGTDTRLAPVLQEAPALDRFGQLAANEARPRLRALLQVAQQRSLPWALDEERLSLGAGSGGRDFLLEQLPPPAALTWDDLHDIPTAVVTGSNGKTTSVRLLAACARAQGWPTAYCCTDGVFCDDTRLAGGDYSGPLGARQVIRTRAAQCAVIETARGGILRRGLAVARARVALVTNVSADHFGEYGIDDLAGLTDVKLTVAGLVPADGLLVLNADDPQLLHAVAGLSQRFGHEVPIGLTALDADRADLCAHRARGGSTCGVRAGHLVLQAGAARPHDLGAITDMPLSVGGTAGYNVSNLAGAALAAQALGIAPVTIGRVLARFGSDPADNPGRMMRGAYRGAQVLIDYAHNPEGLRGLLTVACALLAANERDTGRAGRLAVLIGHAGNRQDADLAHLAQVAAGFAPDLVVIKENESYLRGRAPGEIPRLLKQALLAAGQPAASLLLRDSELAGAQGALEWARPGDVLALPVHAAEARAQVLALLQPP